MPRVLALGVESIIMGLILILSALILIIYCRKYIYLPYIVSHIYIMLNSYLIHIHKDLSRGLFVEYCGYRLSINPACAIFVVIICVKFMSLLLI